MRGYNKRLLYVGNMLSRLHKMCLICENHPMQIKAKINELLFIAHFQHKDRAESANQCS